MKLEHDISLSQSESEAVEDSRAQELSGQVLAKLLPFIPLISRQAKSIIWPLE